MVRRIRRWLRYVVLLLPPLVSVAAAVLWVRSYWLSDSVGWVRLAEFDGSKLRYHALAVRTEEGTVAFISNWQERTEPPERVEEVRWELAKLQRLSYEIGPPGPPNRPTILGFYYDPAWGTQGNTNYSIYMVGVPCWFVVVLGMIPPGVWLGRRVRRRRVEPGHCIVCGYDLRATPERCPECGTVCQAH